MNRTWATILLGVLLGFTLMGMALRGCESGVGAAVGPISAIPDQPRSRLPQTPVAKPEPRSEIRSSLGEPPPTVLTPPARRGVEKSRGSFSVQTPQPTPPGRMPSAMQGFDLAVATARSRLAQNPAALTPGASPPAPAALPVTDPEVRQALSRRNELLRTGATAASERTLDTRLLAESRILSQIEPNLDVRIGDLPGEGPTGSIDGGGGDGSGNDGSEASNSAARDSLTLNSGGGTPNPATGGGGPGGGSAAGGNGGLVAGAGTGTDANGVTNPFAPNPIGNPNSPGQTPPVIPDLPPGIDLPPLGGGSDQPPPPTAVALWQPAPIDPTCGLEGLRTNDLFIGFDQPIGVQVVTSAPPLSLGIVGGTFIQNGGNTNGNGNFPPDPGSVAQDPCLAFDSALTIGDAAGAFFGGPPPPPNDWGTDLNAVLITPLTQPLGIVGVQDRARFGDDRYYVRLGRFTATGNPDFVGGTLIINGFNSATFQPESLLVPVQHCADCWAVEGLGPTGGPTLVGAQFTPAVVQGGGSTALIVTISEPAPEPGVEITLSSSSPAFGAPSTVLIAPGFTTGGVFLSTPDVPGTVDVTVSARLGATTVFADLRIEAVPTDEVLRSIAVSPRVIRGGATATGTITLARVAPPGGLTALLSIDDPAVATVPESVFIPEGEFQTTFDVTAGVLPERRSVLIWAAIDEQVRVTSVLVTLPADLSGDGRIDGADISNVLNNFGSADPDSDLNGDGTVDSQDISFILNSFDPSAPPADPDPFGGSVVARWVPAVIGSDCLDLPGKRSNDLYLGFDDRPNAIVVTSGAPNDLRIENGTFFQDPDNFSPNTPPPPRGIEFIPCLAFDSYLTIGGVAPSIITPQDPTDWGSSLDAFWFTTDQASVIIEQDAFRFGDNRFYVRIGRFTSDQGARVFGAVEASFAPLGGSVRTEVVPITNCPVCWRSFDLTGDGAVSAADVARLMDSLGTDSPAADLNGDGEVTAGDLALMVESATGVGPG